MAFSSPSTRTPVTDGEERTLGRDLVAILDISICHGCKNYLPTPFRHIIILYHFSKQGMQCQPKPRFIDGTVAKDTTLNEITEEIYCIIEELKKICDDRNVQDLEDTNSTGNFRNPY